MPQVRRDRYVAVRHAVNLLLDKHHLSVGGRLYCDTHKTGVVRVKAYYVRPKGGLQPTSKLAEQCVRYVKRLHIDGFSAEVVTARFRPYSVVFTFDPR